MKVAILTSGGDSQGMNSALYSAFLHAKKNKIEIVKIMSGYDGLLDKKISPLTYEDLEGKINDGGSCIKSSRSKRFIQDEYVKKAVNILKKNGIDCLIGIGGNGTFGGLKDLQKYGANVIGIPGTIDNDLFFDKTLGFDSAWNNIVESIDNIYDCVNTFGNIALIEIMGRECDDLTVYSANSLHTEYVITKEEDLEVVAKKIVKDKTFTPIVLLRENSVDISVVVKFLEEKTGKSVKPHNLGYVQRGGRPSAFDRWYGEKLGEYAIKLAKKGKFGVAIGMRDGKVTDVPIIETLGK